MESMERLAITRSVSHRGFFFFQAKNENTNIWWEEEGGGESEQYTKIWLVKYTKVSNVDKK